MILTAFAIAFVALMSGCKSNKLTKNMDNPTGIPVQKVSQTMVSLGGASYFALLAGSSIISTGTTSVTGELGLSPGTSIKGFPPGVLIGTRQINSNVAIQGKLDLTVAYNDAARRTGKGAVTLSGNIGGLTLTSGLYQSSSSLSISSGDLTFDARGDANAVFIIQIAASLSTASGRKVLLKGNASVSNIFWQVGGSATFGSASVFIGTVMAMQSITFNTGAILEGRALTRTGQIVLDGNTIVKE